VTLGSAATYDRVIATFASITPPEPLATDRFVLEPLGPEHNERDHAAWSSSIEHIHASPGFAPGEWGGDAWPYEMSAEANLADLEMHAGEFVRGEAFAYSVLEAAETGGLDVIGCVYIDPDHISDDPGRAMVRSWVRADRAELDVVLADAIREWLAADWPFTSVRFPGRAG